MVFLPCGRALAIVPGSEKRTSLRDGRGCAPMVARLERYRPRCRAGVGTLAARHQVAGRFAGPEPSAPLWILLRIDCMKAARIGQECCVERPSPGEDLRFHAMMRRDECARPWRPTNRQFLRRRGARFLSIPAEVTTCSGAGSR